MFLCFSGRHGRGSHRQTVVRNRAILGVAACFVSSGRFCGVVGVVGLERPRENARVAVQNDGYMKPFIILWLPIITFWTFFLFSCRKYIYCCFPSHSDRLSRYCFLLCLLSRLKNVVVENSYGCVCGGRPVCARACHERWNLQRCAHSFNTRDH